MIISSRLKHTNGADGGSLITGFGYLFRLLLWTVRYKQSRERAKLISSSYAINGKFLVF